MNPFDKWLAEVVAAPLVTAPERDRNAEAGENMWRFSLTREDARAVAPAAVAGFLRAVRDARAEELRARRGTHYPMLFYAWFDAQAAHLCLSATRDDGTGVPPFRCPLRTVAAPESIAETFLASEYHGGIPWGEFSEIEEEALPGAAAVAAPPPLEIWVSPIPGGMRRAV